MYYYSHKSDVRPKGVIFLTGSIIERVRMCIRVHHCMHVIHQIYDTFDLMTFFTFHSILIFNNLLLSYFNVFWPFNTFFHTILYDFLPPISSHLIPCQQNDACLLVRTCAAFRWRMRHQPWRDTSGSNSCIKTSALESIIGTIKSHLLSFICCNFSTFLTIPFQRPSSFFIISIATQLSLSQIYFYSLGLSYNLWLSRQLTKSSTYIPFSLPIDLPPFVFHSLPPCLTHSTKVYLLTATCANIHYCRHDKRVLYCRSECLRDKWVSSLQHAAHVVPIEVSTHSIMLYPSLYYRTVFFFNLCALLLPCIISSSLSLSFRMIMWSAKSWVEEDSPWYVSAWTSLPESTQPLRSSTSLP